MLIFEVMITVLMVYLSLIIILKERVFTLNFFVVFGVLSLLMIILASINRQSASLLIIFLIIFVYWKKRNIKIAILSVGIVYVLNALISEFVFFIHIKIEGVNITVKSMVLMYIYILLLTYVFSKLMSKIISFEWVTLKYKNKFLDISLVLMSLFFIGFVLNSIFNYKNFSKEDMIIFTFLVVLVGILFIGFIILSFKNINKEKEFENKKKEMLLLQNHIIEVDKYYMEIRKFKHDYLNMMSSMEVYLNNRDWERLDAFFRENVNLVNINLATNTTKFAALEKIGIDELKSILRVKLSQALEKNIDIQIEIEEPIDKIHWNNLEMNRVVGILFDNGIECVESIENSQFRIAILKIDTAVVFIFSNNFEGEAPSIQQIYKEGFSTKGKNRGLGLATVRECIDKHDNLTIETKINSGIFTQIVKVSES